MSSQTTTSALSNPLNLNEQAASALRSATTPAQTTPASRSASTPSAAQTALSPVVPDDAPPPVEFTLWEVLASDLAIGMTPTPAILKAYDISREQLDLLQANPFFQKLLQAKQDEIAESSRNPSEAAFVQKMRFIADKATPRLLARLTADETTNKDFATLLQMVVRLARREPPPPRDDAPLAPALTGPTVTFNIVGVPGLDHLATAQVVQAPPIPHAPLQSTQPLQHTPPIPDATLPSPVGPEPSADDLLQMGVL